MRKKIVILGMVTALMATTTACGGNKYVTLGDYTDLKVEYSTSATDVTDESVESTIKTNLSSYAYESEDKNYKAKEGDTVNIDYEGLKDGVAFDGGTAEGYDLELGSGTFIEGFEEGLVGAKKGEKRSLNLTFPKDYSSEDLAGQDVVFKVTVNSIKITPSMKDLDDDFVAKTIKKYTNTDGDEVEVTTVDQYKELVRADLESNNEETIAKDKKEALWDEIVSNAEIKEYPKEDIDAIIKDMEEWYTEYASYYGYENLDDFITANNSTREEFDENAEKSAKEEVASRLVADAIAEKEDLELTDEEYKEGVTKYTKEYGYTSEDEFVKEQGEESIRVQLQKEKVQNYLLDKNTLTLKENTSTGNAEAATSIGETQK